MKTQLRCLIYLTVIAFTALVSPISAQENPPAEPLPIYDAVDVAPMVRLGYGLAKDMAWSPDGTTIAVATTLGVWLYDAEDLKAEPTLLNDTVFSAQVVEYSPDGSLLAGGGDEVYIWDTDSRELVLSIDAPGTNVGLTFSPDSTRLVVSPGFRAWDENLQVWDIASGRPITALDEGIYDRLAYSPDGTRIAGIRCCFWAYLWDAETGETLFSDNIEAGRADESRLAFSPDGQTLVVVDLTGSFVIWDPQTQTQTTSVLFDTERDGWYPLLAAFTPDGAKFMSLSETGILRIWDTVGFDLIDTFDLDWDTLRAARLSPDGTRIAAVDWAGSLRIWDIANGQLVVQRDNVVVDDTTVAFSPDGSLLAFATSNFEIWLWDVAAGERAAVLSGHESTIWDIGFNHDGTLLASASEDGTARVWDVASGTLAKVLIQRDFPPVKTVIFDSEGLLLVADDEVIQIYNLETDEPVELFYDAETDTATDRLQVPDCAPYYCHIYAVAYVGTHSYFREEYHTRKRLAVATSWRVYYGSLPQTGANPLILANVGIAHLTIFALEFQKEYEELVYAGADNVVFRWNEWEGTHVLTTHNSWIYALASGPYYVIASAGCAETHPSMDGDLYCDGADLRFSNYMDPYANTSERTILSQEHGHTGAIRVLAFNPDGTILASVSEDGTLLLWRKDPRDD